MIYDITPPIDECIAVWPGDMRYQRIVQMSLEQGAHLTLSGIRSSLHLGAHADAPNHSILHGESIGERSLHYYIGNCQVISVTELPPPQVIEPKHITVSITAPRVLFCTNTFADTTQWQNQFAHLCPATIDRLKQQNVILVGLDTPSVDAFDSKKLPTHKRLAKYDMAILEGLDLSQVPAGNYELIALPLKLMGADASPVRAMLRTCSGGHQND